MTARICFPDVDWSCCACDTEEVTDEQRARAQRIAASQLWLLSGRRFGACEYIVRPCGTDCPSPCDSFNGSGSWQPYIDDAGAWHNGCGCSPSCQCCTVCAVDIRSNLPIQEIVQIRIGGVVVDPDTYQRRGRQIVKLDGTCWPACQDLGKEATEPGTFAVNYLAGYPLDDFGLAAYAELACEWLLACTGSSSCRLPEGVTRLVRQGVDMSFEDTDGRQGNMRRIRFTGIPRVDDWIRSVNPNGSPGPGVVMSPDYKPGSGIVTRRS